VRQRRSVDLLGWIMTGPRTGVVRYPGGPIDRLLERGDSVIQIQDLSARRRLLVRLRQYARGRG
jgi:hypothetical protein